jgi:hypothetical protein
MMAQQPETCMHEKNKWIIYINNHNDTFYQTIDMNSVKMGINFTFCIFIKMHIIYHNEHD